MLTQILQLIFNILNFIISFILNLIFSVFPDFGLARTATAITSFYGLIGNALQLTYFIVGPMTYIYADIIIILFTAKHIVLPIVNFTRKVVTK